MSSKAHIASIEALDTFYAAMIVYRDKALTVVYEVESEIRRFKRWIRDEQKHHWTKEVRLRARAFEETRQEWFQARISNRQTSGWKEIAFRRARESLREAETKLAATKRWSTLCDDRIDPLARHLEKLQGFLDEELSTSIAYLSQVLSALHAYAERPPRAGAAERPVAPPDAGTTTIEASREAPE